MREESIGEQEKFTTPECEKDVIVSLDAGLTRSGSCLAGDCGPACGCGRSREAEAEKLSSSLAEKGGSRGGCGVSKG